jgi:hypothetical protein
MKYIPKNKGKKREGEKETGRERQRERKGRKEGRKEGRKKRRKEKNTYLEDRISGVKTQLPTLKGKNRCYYFNL